TPLVRYDLLLARDLRIPDDQLLHPLGLEPGDELKAILRDGDVVLRPVEPRRGVALGTRLLELAIELTRGQVLRLVEHQVLEQVGEARFADPLVTRAHAIPGVIRDYRRRVILAHEDAQAVSQPEAFDGERRPEGHRSLVAHRRVIPRALVQVRDPFRAT